MFFKNFKVWETELAGRKLTLETGKMAGLANASIMARYGETEVLCNVTASAKPLRALTSSRSALTTRRSSIPSVRFPAPSREERQDRAKRRF